MCDYFYNAFGELVNDKPKLLEGFNSTHKCGVERFENTPQSTLSPLLLPDKAPSLESVVSPSAKCSVWYPLSVDGKCGRDITLCSSRETLSADKKYCISNSGN